MTKIAPSILAADWANLEAEISSVLDAGADLIHFDVMDGKFVPPITFGPQVLSALRGKFDCPFDVHLMITEPEKQVEAFARAGANFITVHQEACPHLHRVIGQIKDLGVKAGVAINPGTPVDTLTEVIDLVDLALVMTVNPGWGGQSYISACNRKIKALKEMIDSRNSSAVIEIDGGVNDKTVREALEHGAEYIVAGSYVFGSDNRKNAVKSLLA